MTYLGFLFFGSFSKCCKLELNEEMPALTRKDAVQPMIAHILAMQAGVCAQTRYLTGAYADMNSM
eukprot:CAMPEP_0116879042 /NCGR_PEP_ID=MMETSP0463-20121206/10789_1 /TAXON_ID=181622 /ORGANISM="Strombidinopsis sp, Strain SopsisLIS2011" /LENGTH=64 /DNA_ID=CAMNT_0004527861 /DNA_START=133 /DNA_END=327 /DNA_ORIENTATION=-